MERRDGEKLASHIKLHQNIKQEHLQNWTLVTPAVKERDHDNQKNSSIKSYWICYD